MKSNRTGQLTIKQQAKHRAKAFRLLVAMGFKVDDPAGDAFYWLKVSGEKRVFVAFDVPDKCLGGRTGWVWQSSELTESPAFGYSGTTSIGSMWATCEKIVSVTIEQVWSIGFTEGLMAERVKLGEIKAALASTLAKI